MYGGVLYSMADSAMEAACAVHGKAVLTLDLGMNYLRPAFADTIIRAEDKNHSQRPYDDGRSL